MPHKLPVLTSSIRLKPTGARHLGYRHLLHGLLRSPQKIPPFLRVGQRGFVPQTDLCSAHGYRPWWFSHRCGRAVPESCRCRRPAPVGARRMNGGRCQVVGLLIPSSTPPTHRGPPMNSLLATASSDARASCPQALPLQRLRLCPPGASTQLSSHCGPPCRSPLIAGPS